MIPERRIDLKEAEVDLILTHLEVSAAAFNHPAKFLVQRLRKWKDGFARHPITPENNRLRVHKVHTPGYFFGPFGLIRLKKNHEGYFDYLYTPAYKPGPNYKKQNELDTYPLTEDGIREMSYKYSPDIQRQIEKWLSKAKAHIIYKIGVDLGK